MSHEQAMQDFTDYGRAMSRLGGHETYFRIEQKYGLDGYSPEYVSVGLRAAALGKDPHQAIEDYINRKEGS